MIAKIYKYMCAALACCGLTVALTACDSDKEYTTGMPENQLLTSVELNVDSELPLLIGTDSTISYTITPANADFKALKWKSTNEMVASVSPDGTIHALSLGKTTITACPIVGFGTEATQKTISVTVIDKVVKMEQIQFANTETELFEEDQLQLEYTILPADHTYSYLTWNSSDETVATVDNKGLVKGLKVGDVTIRAFAHDKSGVVGEYHLKIIKSEPASDVSLTAYTEPLYWKQTLELQYTIMPAKANAATLQWESSDENVLTVDRGIVKASGFGTATVTATCPNGKQSSIQLTVAPGFYVWDATTDFEGWTINSSFGSIERKDGQLVCTVTTDANHRIYLQRAYSTARNLMDMNFIDYPVIAFKSSQIPAGAGNQINLANYEKTLNVSANMTKITLTDGSQVWYYDASQFASLSNTDGRVPVRAFIFKITKVSVPTFTIDWIRTFKSVDELNNFIQ